MNVSMAAPRFINFVMIIGLLAFEIFNVVTTQNALVSFLPTALGTVLAIALCSLDITGLVRVLTPAKTMKEEPAIVKLLFLSWLCSSMFNTFLTWFSLQMYFDQNIVNMPKSMMFIRDVFPVVLAVMVFLIHFTIIYSIGTFLDKSGVFSTSRQSRQNDGEPIVNPRRAVQQPVGRPMSAVQQQSGQAPAFGSRPMMSNGAAFRTEPQLNGERE